jgi:hypothetical protein
MRSFSDSELLNLWEDGSRRHSLDRALLILNAARPEMSYSDLADWPLGWRNRALADFRTRCFGPDLHAWASCIQCAERLEFAMDGRLLAAVESNNDTLAQVVVDGVVFRLPTSRDLAAATQETDARFASVRLLQNCCAEEAASRIWSEGEMDQIGEAMAQADPLAEIRLTLHCPQCAHEWDECLDLAAFVWAEIDAEGRRLLLQIHSLASTYGWSEAQILALSENRRALYLEMIQG